MGFEGDTPEEQNANQREYILGIGENLFDSQIDQYLPKEQLKLNFNFDANSEGIHLQELGSEEARALLWPKLEEKYREKEVQLGVEALHNLERYMMLNIVDAQWKD